MSIKIKAEIKGVEEVLKNLEGEVEKLSDSPTGEVGFGTDYAVAVHERVEVFHKVGAPKFLESAVNKFRATWVKDVAAKARKALKRGALKPLAEALYLKGLQIDAVAVKRTPVDTGRLRNSHYVREIDGVPTQNAPTVPKWF